MKIFFKYVLRVSFFIVVFASFSKASDHIEYIFPANRSTWVNPNAPIIIRFKDFNPKEILNYDQFITVNGELSGKITGEINISDDGKTIVFKPLYPLKFNEVVYVKLMPIVTADKKPLFIKKFTFTVRPVNMETPTTKPDASSFLHQPFYKKYSANKDGVVVLNGVSVPSDFPYIDITVNDNPDTGYIFCNYEGQNHYNLILDNDGFPQFYWKVPDSRRDFKVQPNGTITMTVREGFGGGGYIAIDNTYTVVDTFFAPTGYTIDEHELLVLENGHYLVTAMDTKIVDMSKIVSGGHPNARVIGYHLIEMDANDNPVFIWRCWDHYDITDAEYVDLTQQHIDFLHTNSIAVDLDGNYLICPKLLNEITKIDKNTGDIIWRLGGAKNEFDYNGFDDFVYMQHSIRVLPNGNYMVFDNGNYHSPHYSRALEFIVDTDNMTVTKVWEFRDSPDRQSHYKGNVQRLPNGNTLINWGMAYLPKLTEVRPNGTKAFEMNFVNPVQAYRTFRFPWQANAAKPFLVAEKFPEKVHLLFNKFGDNDVKEYRVYGGPEPNDHTLLKSTPNPYAVLDENDFRLSNTYYFKVTAVNSHGVESEFSNKERVQTNFVPSDINMVTNGDFSFQSNGWTLSTSGAAQAFVETGNNECLINIANAGSLFEDIQLFQQNLVLYQGQTYTFEFDARSEETRSIDAQVRSANTPFINYGQIGLTEIKRSQKHYSFTFTMDYATTNNARIVFSMGQNSSDVFIDNVSLKRQNSSDVENNIELQNYNFTLNPAFPNPFNSSTKISFAIPVESYVRLDIYNIMGRLVKSIVNDLFLSGEYVRQFDGSELASGLYFAKLTASAVKSEEKYQNTVRLFLIK